MSTAGQTVTADMGTSNPGPQEAVSLESEQRVNKGPGGETGKLGGHRNLSVRVR